MSRGEYLSLEEARNAGLLNCFAKLHSSEGDKESFDRLLERMAKLKIEQKDGPKK